MAEVKWIKIVTDIFDDEKILLIEGLPEADSIIVIWFKLLCLAGKQNNGGVFVMSNGIPYTEQMLSTIFRRKESTIQLALRTFEQFGMVEIINRTVTIPNWGKHQTLDAYDKKRDRDRLYQRERREKQRLLAESCEESSDVVVSDKEGDKEEDNKAPQASPKKVFEHDGKPYRCASYLAGKIKERVPNKVVTEHTLQTWAADLDLLNRVDKQEWEDIAAVLDFSQQDAFWSKNILSGKNLRKNFDRLYLKMQEAQ